MSASRDNEAAAAEKGRFAALLDDAASQGKTLAFWWRDDDAEDASPALDRLLQLAGRHTLPLALSVVPKRATEALAASLATEPHAFVLQHGWRHRNYSGDGEKKMELGAHRPVEVMLDELARGFDRLRARFPNKFLPVLVPPWNRVAETVRDERRTVGLIGLSTVGPAPASAPHWVNVHLDIIDWSARTPIAISRAFAILSQEVERRLAGVDEPIGIMTHHLVHHEANWAFLEELCQVSAGHPGVVWPPIPQLFDVPRPD